MARTARDYEENCRISAPRQCRCLSPRPAKVPIAGVFDIGIVPNAGVRTGTARSARPHRAIADRSRRVLSVSYFYTREKKYNLLI